MVLGELGMVFLKEERDIIHEFTSQNHQNVQQIHLSYPTVLETPFHVLHLPPGYLRNRHIWCIFWTNCFKTLTICLVCINQAKHILFCSACSELSQLFHYLFRWSLSLASTEREIVNVVKIKPGWCTGSCVICKGPGFRDLAEMHEAYCH